MLKFKKEKHEIFGGIEVWFTVEKSDQDLYPFQIVAAREGIKFRGESPVLMDIADLDTFAKTLSLAWRESERLRPKLVSPAEASH